LLKSISWIAVGSAVIGGHLEIT